MFSQLFRGWNIERPNSCPAYINPAHLATHTEHSSHETQVSHPAPHTSTTPESESHLSALALRFKTTEQPSADQGGQVCNTVDSGLMDTTPDSETSRPSLLTPSTQPQKRPRTCSTRQHTTCIPKGRITRPRRTSQVKSKKELHGFDSPVLNLNPHIKMLVMMMAEGEQERVAEKDFMKEEYPLVIDGVNVLSRFPPPHFAWEILAQCDDPMRYLE